MDRIKLKEIQDKHVFGYLRKNPMARFEDIPTSVFIDAMEEAINYSQCCKSDSELLPSKEEMNIKLYDLADKLKTDDKQTEKIYFESGFRYCQQVIKEYLQKQGNCLQRYAY